MMFWTKGGEDKDHLYGGTRDDILKGNGGADHLEGGEGDDTYVAGDGDTIYDTDGFGRVLFGDRGLFGGRKVPNGDHYQSPDGVTTYQLAGRTLNVTGADGVLTIENFEDGDLGIFLTDAPAPDPTQILTGTEAGNYLDSESQAARTVQGNEGRDMVWGSVADDVLEGGTDSDWIVGVGGTDQISGGDGNDYVTWIGGDSEVKGGAGDDIISAEVVDYVRIRSPDARIGADAFWADMAAVYLNPVHSDLYVDGDGHLDIGYGSGFTYGTYSGVSVLGGGWTYTTSISDTDVWTVTYSHPQQAPNGIQPAASYEHVVQGAADTAGVFLMGEIGDDLLVGNAGDDYLEGGEDNDTLVGRSGYDVLLGGMGSDSLLGGADSDYLFGGDGIDRLYGQGGEDHLYGGENRDYLYGDDPDTDPALHGDDNLHGEGGNDQLLGQGGNDRLWGGEGRDLLLGDDGADILYGEAGADELQGGKDDDRLDGGSEDDTLFGEDGEDVLTGGSGGDILYGGADNDILIGGAGDDSLYGGEGDDQYLYRAGDGHDYLEDTAGDNDRLLITGHSPDAVTLVKDDDTLIIFDPQSGDQIDVADWFAGSSLEVIEFSDGTVWDAVAVEEKLSEFYGPDIIGSGGEDTLEGSDKSEVIDGDAGNDGLSGHEGADTLVGGSGDDILDGGQGQDKLYGDAAGLSPTDHGDDELYGGAGNDQLYGGHGNDDYQINTGDGEDLLYDEGGETDRVTFGDGIYASDLVFTRYTHDLRVTFAGSDNDLTIKDWFNADNRIESFDFADGSSYSAEQIEQQVAENDQTLIGTAGDDLLQGGAGNDLLVGGFGNDTYRFNIGGGIDTIDENTQAGGFSIPNSGDVSTGQDTLVFGAGITPEQLMAERVDRESGSLDPMDQTVLGDLHIHVNASDRVIVQDWFSPSISLGNATLRAPRIERFEFANGVVWGSTQISQFVDHQPIRYEPVLNKPLADQVVIPGEAFVFDLPEQSFTDVDSSNLSYSAQLSDGDSLPDWLAVDSATGALTGTPPADFSGILSITLEAVDEHGLTASDSFRLNVGNVDQPPIMGTLGTDSPLGGTQDADIIIGGSGDDELLGLAGDDLLLGGKGDDHLKADFANGSGGYGDDELYGEEGRDRLYGYGGDDLLLGGAGDDYLHGGDGNDVLDGGAGRDELNGGLSGNDRFVFGYGSGTDTLSYTIGEGVSLGEDRIVLGEGISAQDLSLSWDGRDRMVAIGRTQDQLRIDVGATTGYSASYEHISIEFADGTLWDADDIAARLISPEQKDYSGSAGDDVFVLESAFDTIDESQDGGTDLVESRFSYTLPDHVENLTLNGFLSVDATGNQLNNRLIGNSGSNELDGVGGENQYFGGEGDDYYVLTEAEGPEAVTEYQDEGIDTISYQGRDRWSTDLPAHVENLDLYFSTLYSHNSARVVRGNEGDNRISVTQSQTGWFTRGDDGRNMTLYRIEGGGGSDTITGTVLANHLLGGDGDDYLGGKGDDDILTGGEGYDILVGSGGADLYEFDLGDDSQPERVTTIVDSIDRTGRANWVRFGAGIGIDDIRMEQLGDDLLVRYSATDRFQIAAGAAFEDGETPVVDQYHFAGGTVLSHQELFRRVTGQPPEASPDTVTAVEDQETLIAASQLLGNDADPDGGSLTIDQVSNPVNGTVTLTAEGDVRFTPTANFVGAAGFDYRVVDDSGAASVASVTVAVLNGDNDTPELVNPPENQILEQGTPFSFQLPADAFSDPDPEDTLVLSAVQSDGTALPDWLDFDPLTGTFSGTPESGPEGELEVRVVATDGSGEQTSTRFRIAVVQDPPVYDNELVGDAGENRLTGTDGADLIRGEGGSDRLYGLAGDDTLQGGIGRDQLYGDDGDDRLSGGAGDDYLSGGGGNDLLTGSIGNDTYYFEPGGGQDTIDNIGGGNDRIYIGDATMERLSFHRLDDDLVILVDGDIAQQVRVNGHFLDEDHAISSIQSGGDGIAASDIEALLTPLDDVGGEQEPDPFNPAPSDYSQAIEGTANGEQLVGGNGDDYLDGLAGDDQLFGQSGNDALVAGDGADYLDGGDGDDVQLGGAGNDQLGGDAGNDSLRGGTGDDIYVYRLGSGADVIDNSDGGVDWLIFGDDLTADRLTYYRSGEDLLVRVDQDSAQQVAVQGWYSGNTLSYIQPAGGYGIAAAQIEAMATDLNASNHAPEVAEAIADQSSAVGSDFAFTIGADTFLDPDGDSLSLAAALADGTPLPGWLSFDPSTGSFSGTPDVADAGGLEVAVTATDSENLYATDSFVLTVENTDVQTGTEGNDRLDGSSANDVLDGAEGNDRLYGYDGGDSLLGGAGNDRLNGGAGADNLDGGEGRDTAVYASSAQGVQVSLADGLGHGGYAEGDVLADIENLSGCAHADSLTGDSGRNSLIGRGGHDTLLGGAGNDWLNGGAGADNLYGGEGRDTAAYGSSTQGVQVSLADGLGHGGDAEGDVLAQIENLSGSAHDDSLTGDTGANRLVGRNGHDTLLGGAGNDSLNGGAGADQLDGGEGDDTLRGDAGNDTYLFGAGFGSDTVNNKDTHASSVDVARFEDVAVDDLWFSRSGDNLQITVAETDDRVTIRNWYDDASSQLDRIEVDTSVLLNNQVDQLVSAMAAYSVPSGAGNVIPQEVRDELQPVLAATWQTA